MSKARTALRIGAGLIAFIVVGGGGFYAWASVATNQTLASKPTVHSVNFPIPMQPSQAAPAAGGEAAAREQTIARGKHLDETRYRCGDCHSRDFGGKVMLDSPVVGRLVAPNITLGKGGVTKDYTAADWDHIVRHGVRRDGTTSLMPAKETHLMSDRELGDIVTYIRSLPPVDREMPSTEPGPLLKVLVATKGYEVSASIIDHAKPHLPEPPNEAPTAEYGRHIAQPCVGCHNTSFSGGPVKGGDPKWPPASNLTKTGQANRTVADFQRMMREGARPDGSKISEVMPWRDYKGMTDVELQALWAFFQSLPPKETNTL